MIFICYHSIRLYTISCFIVKDAGENMAYTKPGLTRGRIYEFMRSRLLNGEPPTVREVQSAFQMRSVQSARKHLNALVNEGLLIQKSGEARGYRLSDQPIASRLAPVVGQVSAGPFSLAVQEIDGYIPVQSYAGHSNNVFGLRVQGESMIDAGILHDDIVLVRLNSDVRKGDIVVAMVDGEATVKELHYANKSIELHPCNKNYPILSPCPDSLEILGKVFEVRRYLEKNSLIVNI